jgi:hypothetical protein
MFGLHACLPLYMFLFHQPLETCSVDPDVEWVSGGRILAAPSLMSVHSVGMPLHISLSQPYLAAATNSSLDSMPMSSTELLPNTLSVSRLSLGSGSAVPPGEEQLSFHQQVTSSTRKLSLQMLMQQKQHLARKQQPLISDEVLSNGTVLVQVGDGIWSREQVRD